ncbi:methyltransferase domain-containing protein [Actinoplanes sp. NPDC051470]|uniref:class I SAM-dependent methyltransferase n=1 Tax=Actinoplanes sp. NPDC051470 TaxID=3157224 RepID=UPI00342F5D1A
MASRSRPLFARLYQRASVVMDEHGVAAHRRAAVAGLRGRVIEVGAGNGRMFACYPPAVTEVVAVEPEPHLRAAALDAASAAPVPVTVVDGLAESLPGPDAAFDAGVTALVLCSVPSQASALASLHRVIRPGGELRFFEHVAATEPGALRRVQRIMDKTLWPPLMGGCHTGRDTAAAITAAGFRITSIDRFVFPATGPRGPAGPHILGSATRP